MESIPSEEQVSKMNRKHINRVVLMGGLGNQLFQYAFALNLQNQSDSKVILDPNFLSVRLNENELPELSNFQLSENISIAAKRAEPVLICRIMGFALRTHLEHTNPYKKILRLSLRVSLNCMFTIYHRRVTRIVIPVDNGYTKFKKSRLSTIYIGYFQSYKYLDDYKLSNPEFKLISVDEFENFHKFQSLAGEEKPLLVHIRLTDYRNEPNFGIPSKEYYARSISRHLSTGQYQKIWLFSDEPIEAFNYIPKDCQSLVRNISTEISGTIESLAIMRLALGFVIANSSYSWWAARSAFSPSPLVTYPSPWFEKMSDPIDLCPIEWLAIQR